MTENEYTSFLSQNEAKFSYQIIIEWTQDNDRQVWTYASLDNGSKASPIPYWVEVGQYGGQ